MHLCLCSERHTLLRVVDVLPCGAGRAAHAVKVWSREGGSRPDTSSDRGARSYAIGAWT